MYYASSENGHFYAMDGIIANRFIATTRIGKGSFGEIYKGEDKLTRRSVAIKLEPIKTRSPQLDVEARIYQLLSGGVGISSLYFFGMAPSGQHQAMVIDLLSLSLEDILTSSPAPFSLKTVLMLVDQIISRLEWMHRRHFIHRDVKPDNFMVGTCGTSGQVFLIDFGLSKRFEDPRTQVHIPFVSGKNLTGTARYASVNAMRGFEQSRRDDMESLGYVLVYLLKGDLPWQGIPARTQKEKLEKIMTAKAEISIATLCEDIPVEFATYFRRIKALEFEDEPEYSEYRRMFRELFMSQGYVYDGIFDWTRTHVPLTVETRTNEQSGSGEPAAGQRIGRRDNVAPVQQMALKTVLPVLPPVTGRQPGMPSRRYVFATRTPQISPRRPAEPIGRSILPVLVH
jgi:serine/threonine protein kinase